MVEHGWFFNEFDSLHAHTHRWPLFGDMAGDGYGKGLPMLRRKDFDCKAAAPALDRQFVLERGTLDDILLTRHELNGIDARREGGGDV